MLLLPPQKVLLRVADEGSMPRLIRVIALWRVTSYIVWQHLWRKRSNRATLTSGTHCRWGFRTTSGAIKRDVPNRRPSEPTVRRAIASPDPRTASFVCQDATFRNKRPNNNAVSHQLFTELKDLRSIYILRHVKAERGRRLVAGTGSPIRPTFADDHWLRRHWVGVYKHSHVLTVVRNKGIRTHELIALQVQRLLRTSAVFYVAT